MPANAAQWDVNKDYCISYKKFSETCPLFVNSVVIDYGNFYKERIFLWGKSVERCSHAKRGEEMK